MVTDESCYNAKHEKCQELSDDFGIFNDRQQLEKAGPMKPLSLNLQEQKLTADASQNGMDVVSARDDGAEEYIPDDKVENTTKSMARSTSQPCIDARTKLNNDHPRPTNVLDLRNDIIDSISPIGRDGLPGLRSIMNGVSTKMNGKRFETIPSRTPLNTIQVTTSRYHPVSRLISSSSSSEGSKFRFDGQVIDNPRSIGSSANFSSMSYHPYYSYTGQQSPIQPPTHQNYVGGTYLNLGTMGQFYSALPRDFGFNPVLVEPLPVSTPINTAGPSSSALPNAASANYYNEDPNAANASAQKKKYVCTICQKRFARPSSLEQHIRAHTGNLT